MHASELPLPEDLRTILQTLPSALVVGGAVRDWLLGEEPKDLDIEVYKMPEEALKAHLAQFGRLDEVGKAFGVIKLTVGKNTYDFSLPRQDSKSGDGHKDFVVSYDPNMSPTEAANRRDITINSMGWDPKTKQLLDPFGGQADLERRIIRHTSSHFPEDPLRPLRCFQFAARFGMDIAPETAVLCAQMTRGDAFGKLPKSRVKEEFVKFLLKGKDHNKGFKALKDTEWSHSIPEIHRLFYLEQDPKWHPEGDVATHTGHCLSALRDIEGWQEADETQKLKLSFAVLSHDLGKVETTRQEWRSEENRVVTVSPGHEAAGEEPTLSLGERLGIPKAITEAAAILVVHHMRHLQITKDKGIRKLAADLSPSNPHAENARVTTNIFGLGVVVEADHSGRPPLEKGMPKAMQAIVEGAERLGCLLGPQRPLLSGKRLADEPLPQGRAMGEILKRAYQAQILGDFETEADAKGWVKKNKRKILAESKLGPTPLITGKDLMAAGVPQGPKLTELTGKSYNDQLLGTVTTKQEALKALSKEIAKEQGLSR